MSSNIVRDGEKSYRFSVAASSPTTPASGDPIRVGNMTGIALIDEGDDITSETTGLFGPFWASVSVKGVDDSGNSAVALYDSIFYVDADTPKLSKKASGYFFGFALGTVTSGSTGTITVFHPPAGAWTGTVNTGDLAAGAVTAAKLSSTLKTKYVPIPLSSVRELSTGSFINAAGNGGVLASDTTPILTTINGDTDGAWRLAWAASNSDAIGFQIPVPDVDEAANVVIKVRAYMAGATDTPVISADTYFDEGDTKVEDDSDALDATPTTRTITVAASDVPSGAQTMSVELTPGAHTTDILYVTAIWVEYTRV